MSTVHVDTTWVEPAPIDLEDPNCPLVLVTPRSARFHAYMPVAEARELCASILVACERVEAAQ